MAFQNEQRYKINSQYFEGGISIDPKVGVANSFYSSENLDFRSVPSQMSVLPGTRNIANNLLDNVTAFTQDISGVRYGIGDKGNLYRINTSNVVSKIAQLSSNGAAGIYYNQVTDQLYIPGQTDISLYGQVTTGNPGNPIFRAGAIGKSASISDGVVNLFDTLTTSWSGAARNNSQTALSTQGIQVGITSTSQVTTNTAQTYTVQTNLTEAGLNYCYFSPDIEPFYSIAVYIKSKGTGDWTLKLHDSLNNELASVTITNANLTSNAYNEFVFGKQVRAMVNASQTGNTGTYHFHVTSTVADGTIGTINANDMTSADFLLFAYALVQPKNGWHPTAYFGGTRFPLLCIGNERYLSTYNFGNDQNPNNYQFVRHALQFSVGEEVCGMTMNNQYLVIATEKRSTNSSRNFQQGSLYFWDGSTAAPNFSIDVPMGAPYGIHTFNNITYFVVSGSLYAWSGGQTVIKVRKLAYQQTDYLNAVDNTIVNPNMMASRYSLLMIGYPSTTTNVNIKYGIWSWGSVELVFPNSYGYSYTLSNGYQYNNTSGVTNFTIGSIENFVDTMYISWSYTKGGQNYYGIDVVDNFSTPASTFSWTSLIYDGTSIYKTKVATRMKIKFNSFPAGYTLTPFYILDRGNPVYGSESPTVGDTDIIFEIPTSGRFKELQWGFTGTSSGATTPLIISGVTMEIQPLPEEVDLRKDSAQ